MRFRGSDGGNIHTDDLQCRPHNWKGVIPRAAPQHRRITCAARGQQPTGAAAAVGAVLSGVRAAPTKLQESVRGKGEWQAASVKCMCVALHAGSERGAPLPMQTAKLVSRLLQ